MNRFRFVVALAIVALAAGSGLGAYGLRDLKRQQAADRDTASRLADQVQWLERQLAADRKVEERDATERQLAARLARDPYLGISEVAVDEDQKIYRPQFVPVVRYTGEAFAPHDGLMLTRSLSPSDKEVIWSEAFPLQTGDELELQGDRFHDLRTGTSYVKVKRLRDQLIGYLTLQTFVGETTPIGDLPFDRTSLVASIDGREIMLNYPTTAKSALAYQELEGVPLAKAFATPISKGGIHPVTAGNDLLGILLGLVVPGTDEGTRQAALEASRRVFDEYVYPAKIEVRPGAVAWPNTYDFPLAWGGVMKAPWFSGYSNGVIASAAALMFRLTGEDKYAQLARQAVAWMKLPADQGGALYHDGPFSFVAEYPSSVPAEPNIAVLDGEMVAAISVYNTAVLLGDPDMLRFAAQLAYSLVNKADHATTSDGRIQNARYQWLIDNKGYLLPMKRWAAQLGMITKDRRLLEHAAKWRISDVYWPAN